MGVDSGHQSGSRLGVRGSEYLGRNWSAVFDLEMGFDVDTGTSAQSGQLFGRQAYWGFRQAKAGTFVLGPHRDAVVGHRRLRPVRCGRSVRYRLRTYRSARRPSSRRIRCAEDNSVALGVTDLGRLQVCAPVLDQHRLGAETAPSGTNTRRTTSAANWTWGPLFLAATYDGYNFANCYGAVGPTGLCTTAGNRAGAGNPDQKMLQVGGVFDFKFLKVHAAYADQNNISRWSEAGLGVPTSWSRPAFNTVARGYYNNQAYMVGLTVPLIGGRCSVRTSGRMRRTSSTDSRSSSLTTTFGASATRIRSRVVPTCMSAYGQRKWDGSITDTTGAMASSNASQIVDRELLRTRCSSPVLSRATTQYRRPLLAAAFSPLRPEKPDYASAAISSAARCRSISPMRSLRSTRSLAVRTCSQARARSR